MKPNASLTTKVNDDKYLSGTTKHQLSARSPYETTEVMKKMTFKEHIEMYRKFFFEKKEKVPGEELPQVKLNPKQLLNNKVKGLKGSWLGHSSILLNIDGFSVLTDPIFKRKVSFVGPTRFNKELVIDNSDLPHIDVVIISHDHYDHLNKPSIQMLAGKAGVFIVPRGVGNRLQKWGVPVEKIVELNWWGKYQVTDDFKIVATPSQHFSGRGLFDRNRTLWASWVIITANHRVFYSGDSGYFEGFKDIGNKYGPFDVTFLECGAYNKQWAKVHMFPEQTVQAFQDLRGKILQPIHWATFNLALHAWYEPIERLMVAANFTGADVSAPVMGGIVNYEEPLPLESWWLPAMERGRMEQQQRELLSAGQ